MSEEFTIDEPNSKLHSNTKVQALKNTLLQSLSYFRDLVTEYEEIFTEYECYKSQILIQKEKCESESCASSEALKKVIAVRDDTIQSIGNLLKEFQVTKDFNIVNEVFRLIYGDQSPVICTKSEKLSFPKSETSLSIQKIDGICILSDEDVPVPKSEIIDSTSGRKSPIIQSKKLKTSSDSSVETTRSQEKKKCPSSWPTPEKKTVKLSFPTPARGNTNGKFRQARLSFVKAKMDTVVDLTCSPSALESNCDSFKLIKKESIENDDTILPSPTSGPVNFTSILKSSTTRSPYKQKKSLSTLKLKVKEECKESKSNKENKSLHKDGNTQNIGLAALKESNRSDCSPRKLKRISPTNKPITECTTFIDENILKDLTVNCEMNESVDILKHFPNRFATSPTKQTSHIPLKSKQNEADNVDESMSLLHKILSGPNSPSKPQLSQCEIPSSISVLTNFNVKKELTGDETVKRSKPDLVQPIFKEPTLRKKAEKMALPGWACNECKEFYADMYKDDPVMLQQKMEACSRHRGRQDPTRPLTPPGFWQPRWDVPSDTDEFNRLNNAI